MDLWRSGGGWNSVRDDSVHPFNLEAHNYLGGGPFWRNQSIGGKLLDVGQFDQFMGYL
jgi:hypothetical protein